LGTEKEVVEKTGLTREEGEEKRNRLFSQEEGDFVV